MMDVGDNSVGIRHSVLELTNGGMSVCNILMNVADGSMDARDAIVNFGNGSVYHKFGLGTKS